MKKPLAILLSVLLLMTCVPLGAISVSAATSGVTEDGLRYEITDGEVTITGFTDDIPADVFIPSTIEGYPVTTIRDYAFYRCAFLTSVIFGNSVTTIGDSAFYVCSSLTSITFSDSVTAIGGSAFFACDSLTAVTIGTGVTTIGDSAFSSCDALASVIIPDSVTTIGDYAFYYCDSLTSVALPDSVTAIGDSAFSGCDALTSVTIGDSVVIIGDYAFYNCDSLTSVTLPDSVTTIGEGAFYDCPSLTLVTIGDSVTTIRDEAFRDCISLASVTIGNSVTTIGDSAFYNCDSLTSVALPDSVTTIEYTAFASCDALTSVTIPDSVTTIKNGVFSNCTSLTDVYYTGSEADRVDITIGSSNTALLDATWHYNWFTQDGLKYGIADGEVTIKGFTEDLPGKLVIPATIEGYPVTTIRESAFNECTFLTSVTIPDSATTIGDRAFSYCNALTMIVIPDSITTVEKGAFLGCYQLDDIYYAGSEEDRLNMTIADWNSDLTNATWHYDCLVQGGLMYEIADGEATVTGYTDDLPADLVIPSTIEGYPVTTIREGAFASCASLTSVTIPDSVTSIGVSAFMWCESLTSVIIPDSVTTIEGTVFYQCSSLTEIFIPDSITSLGERAFCGCSSLTSITLPDSVTVIGSTVFYDCSSLTSIILPDSITSIGAQAFDETAYFMNADNRDNGALYIGNHLINLDPSSSGEYVIRDGTKTIAGEAFAYCHNLTSVVIPDDVTTIGAGAFTSCYNLTSITIPRSVTVIEESIFGWGNELFVDVYYDGYRTDRDAIAIDGGNGILFHARWHYTPCPGEEHVYAFPCDEWCNRCEQLRTPEAAHNGDASCTVCGKTFLYYEIVDGEAAITGCSNELKGHYVIPDTIEGYPVTALWEGAFYGCNITGLTLPAHLREFSPWAIYSISTIETIAVSPDNAYFCVVDGALYSKDMTDLVYVPSAQNITSFTVPDGVTNIESMVFTHFRMETLYLPVSVTCFGDGNIGYDTQIYYGGSEEDWENVSIDWMFNGGGGNVIHYNYSPVCTHVYDGDADPDCNLCGVTRWAASPDADVIVSGKDSGVTLPAGTVVSVEQVAADGVNPDLSVLDNPNVEVITVYDITLTADGVSVQPGGVVSVTLPIPAAVSAYTDLQVVYVDDMGNTTLCETIVNGDGTVTFFTDHFSYYAIVGTSAIIPGDVDGNGKLNNRDLGLLQRYINGYEVTVNVAAADMDGNGKVNNRDLGLLQRQLNN